MPLVGRIRTKTDSYFVFNNTAFLLKLIGKTYKNKKMYVDISPETELNDSIFLIQTWTILKISILTNLKMRYID